MIRWGPHHEDEVDVADDDDFEDDDDDDFEHLQRSPSSGTESIWDITDDSLGGLNLRMIVILMMIIIITMMMMIINMIIMIIVT